MRYKSPQIAGDVAYTKWRREVAMSNVPRISIKDIAKAAKVSHSTVSRALRGNPLVKSETRDSIKRIAREMHYSPDFWARGLVTGRTQTIGIVVTSIDDPFVAGVIQGIESTAYEHDYTVILMSSYADPEREMSAVNTLSSRRVDGVIVESSRVGALYQKYLDQIGVPIVLLNSHSEQTGRHTYSVTVDNQEGGYTATQYLIDAGHRRIAYITGPANHSSNSGRLAGYRQALTESDIKFDPELIALGNGRADGGGQAWPSLARLAPRPTAVFCFNDMTAIGLLQALRASGVNVPADLSVVGFDDIPFARYIDPSLTTINQPAVDMGKQAMRMALALMTNTSHVTDVVIAGKLVVRESTAPA
jgi:DNA-binding LacI/PurR family transcriptional regulator